MIVVTVKYKVHPEWVDRWMDMVDEFTTAMRDEPGNLWFTWTQNVDDSTEFVEIAGWREDLVEEHWTSPLLPKIKREWPEALRETPERLFAIIEGNEWKAMDHMPVPALETEQS